VNTSLAKLDAANEQAGLRMAPHNAEAEAGLLGAILVNNEAFFRVSDFLTAEHFYLPQHQRIYDIAGQLIRAGKVATPITVKTFFNSDEKLGDMGVAQYLLRLHAEATIIINVIDYGQTIYDLSIRRNLIGIGEDMVNVAYDSPVDASPRKQIEEAERQLFSLAETGRYDGGFHSFSSAIKEAIDMASSAFQRDGHLSGIATGLEDFDRLSGGLQKSDLIILAGRPGMGKTSLATNVAFNVAKAWRGGVNDQGVMETEDGGIVGFFSLEMSAEQLATRIIAEQSGVSSSRIRRGDVTREEFEKIVVASQAMQNAPLWIDQTGGISIAQMAARARRLKRQKGLDLLIIDYLQLLTGSSKRSGESRVQEITEITTGLKALAKELAIPVIALSQLSRQVENRDDKRPQLSDLRESGSIEQDADVVLFVYREEYYLNMKKPVEGTPEFEAWAEEMNTKHGVAEVIIGKQRHGPTGTVELQFDSEVTRFSTLVRDDHLPQRMD
jgi:replicative DNA helicase